MVHKKVCYLSCLLFEGRGVHEQRKMYKFLLCLHSKASMVTRSYLVTLSLPRFWKTNLLRTEENRSKENIGLQLVTSQKCDPYSSLHTTSCCSDISHSVPHLSLSLSLSLSHTHTLPGYIVTFLFCGYLPIILKENFKKKFLFCREIYPNYFSNSFKFEK